MSIVDLEFEREKASDNNAEIRPASVLRMALEETETSGDVSRVVIIVEHQIEDGDYEVSRFRAGCTRYEEVALLELAKQTTLKDWLR